MKLFGFEIKRPKKTDTNKVVGSLVYGQRWDDAIMPNADFYSMLKANRGWIYTCSSKNAVSIASTPIRLYVGKKNNNSISSVKTAKITKKKEASLRNRASLSNLSRVKKAIGIEEVLEHPMLDLFNTVNNFMNKFYLFELTSLYQELCGNAYWYILNNRLGVPIEIWPVPPQHLVILPDERKFIKGYELRKGMDRIPFKEDEIIHFKFPSVTSVYYGCSPLSAVTDSYNIHQSMNRYELAIFKNMGRPEGAFETEQELSQYEFDRLKEELSQSFGGLDNVGKSPLLEKGVTFKNYGSLPRDLSYLSGRSKIKEEITNAYGQSMALWDKDSTRANATVANENFMRDAIRPRLIRMEEKLNEKLAPRYDEKLFIAFDDPTPEDRDYRLKERESNIKSGYSSINMERESDNEDPVEWGDWPIFNQSMVRYDPDREPSSGGNWSGDENPEDNGDGNIPPKFLESIAERITRDILGKIKQ